MCGIVGGVGKIDFRQYLLGGLKKLDYRGYDSAGLAYMENGGLHLYRVAGRVEDLAEIVPEIKTASIGIAHTRWATHGQPNQINAHPQTSFSGLFSIVHNGVIENYKALKNQLAVRGFSFASQTDTEVIADLLERFYLRGGSVLEAVRETVDALEGSFACGIIFKNEPNRLYFMKKASPLLIGISKNASYLASDAVPMISYTTRFIDLDDGEYGYLEKGKAKIFLGTKEVEPKFVERKIDDFDADLQGYPHYMLKEIEEIPSVLSRLFDNYFDAGKFCFNEQMIATLRKAKAVHFLACGTSYYASMMGVNYFRYLGKRATVDIASEWAYNPYDIDEAPIYILLSQSGETADLIRCQKIINDRGLTNIAVTNTKGSTIERKATFSCLLYAGLEVAVASTKSYICQVGFLAMLIGALNDKTKVMVHLDRLVETIRDITSRKEEIHKLAKRIAKAKTAFFIGRGSDYLACLEGALKLKEVTYIHAEAYPGGELKHGPIALIEKNTVVIGFLSDPALSSSLRNNLEELSSRGAKTYVFSCQSTGISSDAFLIEEVKPYLASSALVVVAQYLAYYVALEKGLPIDKPRNLAKAVTVE